MGVGKIFVSDYLDCIVENVDYNLRLNSCTREQAIATRLDWNRYNEISLMSCDDGGGGVVDFYSETEGMKNLSFDIIMASDVIYSNEHGSVFPKFLRAQISHSKSDVVSKKTEVCVVLPNAKYRDGIKMFEHSMLEEGFVSAKGYPKSLEKRTDEESDIAFKETSFTIYKYRLKV